MNKQENVPVLRFPEFTENWVAKKLGDVAKIERGKSKHRPRDADFLFGGEYPFIQTGDIRKAELYLTGFTQTYSEAGLKQSKLWDENTLCITIAANIAETTILKIKACFPDSIIGLVPKENEVIVLFVKYLFDKFKIQIQSLSQGVAQDNLNQEKLSNIKFIFPTLPEQQKIATFLSSVDEKLQGLKKKKSLLEAYKKGMMQRLFSSETGLTRLEDEQDLDDNNPTILTSRKLRFRQDNGEDFPDWEEKTLGEVATFSKGKGISKADIDDTGITECIRYGELYTYYGETINVIKSKTNISPEHLVLSEANDIIIPASGETQIDIATASCVLKSGIALGGDLNIIKTKQNGVFMAYYLNNARKQQIAGLAQGISVVHLYASQLQLLELSLPTLPEQTKIANFLSAIDEKIANVSQEIEQVTVWKKGLLQQMFV